MFEKRLKVVPPQLFTANGTNLGKITIPDACAFKVKQRVILKSFTQGPLVLEVKRVESDTVLFVGPYSGHQQNSKITDRTDISTFLVADSASIEAEEQNRPSIPQQEIERLTYEEEPVVARRVIMVDACGDKISDSNPLPVSIPGLTVHVDELNVALDHRQDYPNAGDPPDSVQIGDGVDVLAINPDGSINVVIPPGAGGIPVNEFSQISSVAAGVLTDILTYTVPSPYNGILFRIEVGGNNVATYEIYINNIIEARIRTWFSTSLTQICEFSSGASGFKLFTGDIVKVKVIHSRPFAGDFEARLQAQLQ